MGVTHFKGQAMQTCGTLPETGSDAPDFKIVQNDLAPLSLKDLKGSKTVLSIFPSVDTPVCSMSVIKFNKEAAQTGAKIVCISKDLPFAFVRFCGAEGIENVITGSDFQNKFGPAYGVLLCDGPLEGLLARAVVVLDENAKVIYSQLVDEITQEPDYQAALDALK